MRMDVVIRFGYGSVIPWVRTVDGVLVATAGPHTLEVNAGVEMRGENMKTVAEFEVTGRNWVAFTLNYHPSFDAPPPLLDPWKALAATEKAWRQWSRQCTY